MKECEWDLDFAENQDHWFLFADDIIKPVYLDQVKSCFGGQRASDDLTHMLIYRQIDS